MNCIIHNMFLVIRTTYAIYSSMTVTYAISTYSFVECNDPEMPLHCSIHYSFIASMSKNKIAQKRTK